MVQPNEIVVSTRINLRTMAKLGLVYSNYVGLTRGALVRIALEDLTEELTTQGRVRELTEDEAIAILDKLGFFAKHPRPTRKKNVVSGAKLANIGKEPTITTDISEERIEEINKMLEESKPEVGGEEDD